MHSEWKYVNTTVDDNIFSFLCSLLPDPSGSSNFLHQGMSFALLSLCSSLTLCSSSLLSPIALTLCRLCATVTTQSSAFNSLHLDSAFFGCLRILDPSWIIHYLKKFFAFSIKMLNEKQRYLWYDLIVFNSPHFTFPNCTFVKLAIFSLVSFKKSLLILPIIIFCYFLITLLYIFVKLAVFSCHLKRLSQF